MDMPSDEQRRWKAEKSNKYDRQSHTSNFNEKNLRDGI